MFKKLMLGVIVVSLLGLLGITEASTEKTKVTVFTDMMDPTYEKLLTEAFKRQNPDLALEFQQVPAGSYWEMLLLSAATGILPDVIGSSTDFRLDTLIEGNVVTPLNSVFEEVGIDVSKYPKWIFDMMSRDGVIYALPTETYTRGFINYNKDLFDEAGIAYPTPDTTWEEFREMCRKLTIKDEKGNVIRYGVFNKYPWIDMALAFGGRPVDDPFHPTEALFGHPNYVSALKEYRDMVDEGVMMNIDTFNALGGSKPKIFFEQKVAMVITGAATGELNFPFDWDVELLPIVNEDTAYMVQVNCSSISTSCKNPEAAMRYLEFRYLGRESLIIHNTVHRHQNDLPPWVPELQDLYEQLAIGRDPANWKVTYRAQERGNLWYAFEGAAKFSPLFTPVVIDVMSGRKPLTALIDAEREAQKVIDELPWNKDK